MAVILQGWPMLILILLGAGYSGIIIWLLVSVRSRGRSRAGSEEGTRENPGQSQGECRCRSLGGLIHMQIQEWTQRQEQTHLLPNNVCTDSG